MKTKPQFKHVSILGTAFMALLAPLALAQSGNNSAPGQQKKLPVVPAGWINANPTVVQTGTHPTLTWGINYPSDVHDVISIEDSDTIVAKEEICVDCRVLGNGVTAHWSDGRWEFVPAEALVSFNGGNYERVFYGTNDTVNPNTVVWQRCEVKTNQVIRFGGRHFWRSEEGPLYKSGSSTQNIRILTDGQAPPSYASMHPEVPTIEDFIKPYLDPHGFINIGPLDVLVLMELTHNDSQQSDSGYDLQDMVMLCTVKPKPKNNNRSGLGDGTNPGQGNQMGNNDGTDNPNQAPHSGGSN